MVDATAAADARNCLLDARTMCVPPPASVFGLRVCGRHWSENPWIPAPCPREGGERESIRPIRTRMPPPVAASGYRPPALAGVVSNGRNHRAEVPEQRSARELHIRPAGRCPTSRRHAPARPRREGVVAGEEVDCELPLPRLHVSTEGAHGFLTAPLHRHQAERSKIHPVARYSRTNVLNLVRTIILIR